MRKTIRDHIVEHFVEIFVHDVVAAIYDLWNHRLALALSADDERRLSIAVNFSMRSNYTRNVMFCITTLDSILSDDLTADLASVELEESIVVAHPKALLFFVPIVAQYIKFSRTLNSPSMETKAA